VSKHALQSDATTPEQATRGRHVPDETPQFLRQAQICRRLSVSVRTWKRWRAARQAPAPVQGLPGRPRWRLRDIEDFERGVRGGTGRRFFVTSRHA
jgi:hypothetical protein